MVNVQEQYILQLYRQPNTFKYKYLEWHLQLCYVYVTHTTVHYKYSVWRFILFTSKGMIIF